MSNPLVSIITVNFNQIEVTCALLKSIQKQGYEHVEVWVVDNGSQENPESMIKKRFPEVHFLRSDQNLGFAGGNNLALPYCKGEYLFFINNDAELTKNCLSILLQHFDNQPNTGIVSPLICYYGNYATHDNASLDLIQYAGMTKVSPLTGRNEMIGNKTLDKGQFNTESETGYAHGAAMMVSRRVIDEVGPMSEDFFLYYEELDWCERIRKSGFEVWIVPQARVYHKESLTVSSMGTLKTFYLHRNRLLFMKRHHSALEYAFFCAFFYLIAAPKHSIRLVLKGEWANLGAFWRAVV